MMNTGDDPDIVSFPLIARRMKEETGYHVAAFNHQIEPG
jgi:hypothetical protein